jgi:hypothetical protein
MLDLVKLEAERDAATIDKADLFDFYHNNWHAVVRELKEFQDAKRLSQAWARAHLEESGRNAAEAYADE